jgi:DNA processing protein
MALDIDVEGIIYQLALTFVPGIGSRTGRALLEHYGNPMNIFKAPLKDVKHIIGISEVNVKAFRDEEIMKRAEEELQFITKHNIGILFCNSSSYPQRLNNCSDAPLLLYYKGNAELNAAKIVAIVGTRKNTDYGSKLCEDLVEGLQSQENILIVSGLASGIDSIAHKRSLAFGVPTIGVLAHGIDRIYPPSNKALSNEMVKNGAVLTEYVSKTIPDRFNFPMRNRIVAGMSDVTVVIESDIAGGALITAHLAAGYNREVAAFPGRVNDSKSAGCNELIRTNVASMITKADDLLDLMNWNTNKKQKTVQKQLFLNLSPEEQKIIDTLQTKDSVHSDELYHHTGLNSSQLASTLLQLEMQGLVKALPGKYYRIN